MKNFFENPLEKLNPVCKDCGGGHKTIQHSQVEEKGKELNLSPACKECGESHETSEHDSAELLDK